MSSRGERGATLVELVISIVVISIAASAVLGVLSATVGRSADAMVLRQGVAIAQSYIEEISRKPFDDPDGVDGEGARADFDDIDDYDGLVDTGARDQFGAPLAPLAQYTVTVVVTPSTALTGVTQADTRRIDVRVDHSATGAVALTAYKTRL